MFIYLNKHILVAFAINNYSYFLSHYCRLEKINGDIYDFSTNKKQLKQSVEVWLPCHPITHPHLQEIKLKAKFKGEDEWVYHDWTLYVSRPIRVTISLQKLDK